MSGRRGGARQNGDMAEHDDTRAHPSRRRFALRMQQPLARSTVFDRIVFLIGAASAVWLSVIIAMQGFRTWYAPILLIPVWAILAYLALPRLHKMLSDLYVPDYFFGRTRTGDGLLGDPVNLGVDGDFDQLDAVMIDAGWIRADEITAASTWGIITSTLLRRSYPTAPVSPLYLFGRRHDIAYQQEVEGNPKQRHHVRFWHTPEGWLLPGGAKTDWLGAATYDTDVGLSLFTLQVTHRIDENTDVERDHVVATASAADDAVGVRRLHDFTTGYHSRNGGGDRFVTDGDLPIIDVTRVRVDADPLPATPGVKPGVEESLKRAPLSVALGVFAVVLGSVLSIVSLGPILDAITKVPDLEQADYAVAVVVVIALLGVALIVEIVLALRVLRGGARVSRFVLIAVLTLGVFTVAVSYLAGDEPLALNLTLLGATAHCGALLAFSSESAAHWSRRRASRVRSEPRGENAS